MISAMLSKEKKWYAVYTKPRWEKKTDQILIQKGIESWCPMQKVERKWTDRKKIIDIPIFRSYVFVRINEIGRVPVLETDGVINFVHYLGKPAVIRDEEIDLIKQYLLIPGTTIQVADAQVLKEKTRVKIKAGVFMDNEGEILRIGKKKVYVQLQTLGQVMVVEFPIEQLLPV
ncbi:UpxY family transcription antiterminator [Hydrotalea sp.]|uniref:UpxY family transcription antiterminator n=1 Tax=Hydrotalea sp. TaxID=2881279 RepID=UPI00260E4CDB|nr:UpxY family transcription antiterminator [Hydrotalea sp.]